MSYVFFRDLSLDYRNKLRDSIPELLAQVQDLGLSYTRDNIDVDAITRHYKEVITWGEDGFLQDVVINGAYVLTFAMTEVWYLKGGLTLCEQFLLKLPPHLVTGPGGNPLPVIEQLAKDYGATRVILSDGLGSSPALGRLYNRGGYERMASEYVKEV